MNCKDIRNNIDLFLDGDLTNSENHHFELHVKNCQHCQSELALAKQIRKELSCLHYVAPTEGLESRVFSQVVAKKKAGQNDFKKGFSSAVAAVLVIWFSVILVIPNSEDDYSSSQIQVAINEMKFIQVVIETPKDFKSVQIALKLPANFNLKGAGNRKEVKWQTSLKKGANILTLPMIASEYGEGELVAQVFYGDQKKIFKVKLKTVKASLKQTERRSNHSLRLI